MTDLPPSVQQARVEAAARAAYERSRDETAVPWEELPEYSRQMVRRSWAIHIADADAAAEREGYVLVPVAPQVAAVESVLREIFGPSPIEGPCFYDAHTIAQGIVRAMLAARPKAEEG